MMNPTASPFPAGDAIEITRTAFRRRAKWERRRWAVSADGILCCFVAESVRPGQAFVLEGSAEHGILPATVDGARDWPALRERIRAAVNIAYRRYEANIAGRRGRA